MFSRRSGLSREPNALAGRDARLDLTASNPTRVGLPPVETSLPAVPWEPAPLGNLVAREQVASSLGVPAEDVVLTASTSEAYELLFALLCDPGDLVLAPRPSYPLLEHLARFAGVRLGSYPLLRDDGWLVGEVAALRGARAIVAVSPNHPTGSVLRVEEQARLAATGMPLIVDEVFAGYPLEGEVRSAIEGGDELRFVLGGLSKRCGMPQMKLGWIVLAGEGRAEARARLELLADARLSVSGPVQAAVRELLEEGEGRRAAIAERLRRNLEELRRVTTGSSISVPRVEGGWYAMLRVPRVRSDQEHALRLLEHGVRVHPGWFYDAPEGYLVVSLLTPEDRFAEGVGILCEQVG